MPISNFWNLSRKHHQLQKNAFENKQVTSSEISLPLESKESVQLSFSYIPTPCFSSLENINIQNHSDDLSDYSCVSSIYDENQRNTSIDRSNCFSEIEKDVLQEGMMKFAVEDYIQEIQKVKEQYLLF